LRKLLKDGSRIYENYRGVSHFCLKACVHLDVLAALQLFPLPAPKSPIEDTNRTYPYSGRAIPDDNIARGNARSVTERQSGRHATITCIRSAMRILDGRPRRSQDFELCPARYFECRVRPKPQP
jgi:hypothetical protein